MCEWRFDFVSTSDNIEIYYLVVECEIKHEERTSLKIGRDCEHMTFFLISSLFLLSLLSRD